MSRLQRAIEAQFAVALERRRNPAGEKSYTNYLYRKGQDTILKKCGEEAFETVIAAKNGDKAELVGELNDLLYNLTVLLCYQSVPFDPVMAEVNIRCASQGMELDALAEIIAQRRDRNEEESYTAYLFEKGLDKILKKVGEATSSVLLSAKAEQGEWMCSACADLLFHLLVTMEAVGVTTDDVAEEMERRLGKSGNLKTFRTTDVNT